MSGLNHTNIAVVTTLPATGDVDFIVMELVPGTSLDEKLARGPMSESDVIAIGIQMSEALAAAHDQGVIQRDLKPGNIRVTPEGRLKVLDFGLARTVRAAENAQTESVLDDGGGTAGALPSMALEQLRNEGVGVQSETSGPLVWSSMRWRRAGARSAARRRGSGGGHCPLSGGVAPATSPGGLSPSRTDPFQVHRESYLDSLPVRRRVDIGPPPRRRARRRGTQRNVGPFTGRPGVVAAILVGDMLAAVLGAAFWRTRTCAAGDSALRPHAGGAAVEELSGDRPAVSG